MKPGYRNHYDRKMIKCDLKMRNNKKAASCVCGISNELRCNDVIVRCILRSHERAQTGDSNHFIQKRQTEFSSEFRA